jgi:tRNA (guanine-N7-)-methyltransferase
MMTNTIKNKNLEGSANYKPRSLFGRRQGRPLKAERRAALEDILPQIEIPKDKLTEEYLTAPSDMFPNPLPSYWLEIGFGQGEHVATLAEKNPDTGYLGAEPFINGMAAFLKNIEDKPKDNIRVLMDDGMIIARSLKSKSLDGIYILNPDPWHKKRHHKRRIINQTNLDIFAKILKPDGMLVMTSDVIDLAGWMCTHASNHPAFEWQARCKDDWSIPPADWRPTRYEQKGAKGAKKMVYLFFKKKADQ